MKITIDLQVVCQWIILLTLVMTAAYNFRLAFPKGTKAIVVTIVCQSAMLAVVSVAGCFDRLFGG